MDTAVDTSSLSHAHLVSSGGSSVTSTTSPAAAGQSTTSEVTTHAVAESVYQFDEHKWQETDAQTGETSTLRDRNSNYSRSQGTEYELESTTTTGRSLDLPSVGFSVDVTSTMTAAGGQGSLETAQKTDHVAGDGTVTVLDDVRFKETGSWQEVTWGTSVPGVGLWRNGSDTGTFSLSFGGSFASGVSDTWEYDNGESTHTHAESHSSSQQNELTGSLMSANGREITVDLTTDRQSDSELTVDETGIRHRGVDASAGYDWSQETVEGNGFTTLEIVTADATQTGDGTFTPDGQGGHDPDLAAWDVDSTTTERTTWSPVDNGTTRDETVTTHTETGTGETVTAHTVQVHETDWVTSSSSGTNTSTPYDNTWTFGATEGMFGPIGVTAGHGSLGDHVAVAMDMPAGGIDTTGVPLPDGYQPLDAAVDGASAQPAAPAQPDGPGAGQNEAAEATDTSALDSHGHGEGVHDECGPVDCCECCDTCCDGCGEGHGSGSASGGASASAGSYWWDLNNDGVPDQVWIHPIYLVGLPAPNGPLQLQSQLPSVNLFSNCCDESSAAPRFSFQEALAPLRTLSDEHSAAIDYLASEGLLTPQAAFLLEATNPFITGQALLDIGFVGAPNAAIDTLNTPTALLNSLAMRGIEQGISDSDYLSTNPDTANRLRLYVQEHHLLPTLPTVDPAITEGAITDNPLRDWYIPLGGNALMMLPVGGPASTIDDAGKAFLGVADDALRVTDDARRVAIAGARQRIPNPDCIPVDIPVNLQTAKNNCVGSAMDMLLDFHRPNRMSSSIQGFHLADDGLRGWDMAEFIAANCDQHGLGFARGSFDDAVRSGQPFVAVVMDATGRGHAVVVQGVVHHNGLPYAVVRDPAHGAYLETVNWFTQRLVSPQPDLSYPCMWAVP